MNQYKMTVIMPSYNNGQYIRQALDSIIMQKVDFDYQVIITDDASQDDSPQIIREYKKKYSDKIMALYSNTNYQLFRNMLKALEKMNSEYFCVLDPDDYWTDDKRLQKAVDFLDANPEYTIYGTNAYKLYNDGTVENYYDRPNIDTYSSTFEDFLNGKAVLSNTFCSTYRNVYFSDGIPGEYMALAGSCYEEIFRADSARNLIHLRRGKAYFVNEYVGYSRRHGKGLTSSLLEYERYIKSAFAHIGFFDFFGKEHEKEYVQMVRSLYTIAVKEFCKWLVRGKIPKLSRQYEGYFCTVMEWLQIHEPKSTETYHIPFSLERFSEMSYRKIIIWGTGLEAPRIIETYHIPIRDDTLFVDNDSSKQGKQFMGKPIKSPDVIKEEQNALILIASTYYKDILRQIKEEELCTDDRIINIYSYEKFSI